jgi:hypothetical protein
MLSPLVLHVHVVAAALKAYGLEITGGAGQWRYRFMGNVWLLPFSLEAPAAYDSEAQAIVGALLDLARHGPARCRRFAVDLLAVLLADPSAVTGVLADMVCHDQLVYALIAPDDIPPEVPRGEGTGGGMGE